MAPDQRSVDALLDAYGRAWRALAVLHFEADTDLDLDAFVELANVRYQDYIEELQPPEETT